ncbi:unnamed protein product, partial [Laminaria digitata]
PPRSQQGTVRTPQRCCRGATPAKHQLSAPTKGTVRTPPRSCRGGQRTILATGDGSPRPYGVGPGSEPTDGPRGRGRAACGSIRVDDISPKSPGEDILKHGGRTGYDGWRNCGENRGVERVHAEWFPSRRRTAPAIRSRCRAFTI